MLKVLRVTNSIEELDIRGPPLLCGKNEDEKGVLLGQAVRAYMVADGPCTIHYHMWVNDRTMSKHRYNDSQFI